MVTDPEESQDVERRQFVVCGDDPLAFRLANELVHRYFAAVTVVLPSRRHLEGRTVADLAELRGVRLLGIRTPRQVLWRQAPGREFTCTDTLLVVATRTGLGRLLLRAATDS